MSPELYELPFLSLRSDGSLTLPSSLFLFPLHTLSSSLFPPFSVPLFLHYFSIVYRLVLQRLFPPTPFPSLPLSVFVPLPLSRWVLFLLLLLPVSLSLWDFSPSPWLCLEEPWKPID